MSGRTVFGRSGFAFVKKVQDKDGHKRKHVVSGERERKAECSSRADQRGIGLERGA